MRDEKEKINLYLAPTAAARDLRLRAAHLVAGCRARARELIIRGNRIVSSNSFARSSKELTALEEVSQASSTSCQWATDNLTVERVSVANLPTEYGQFKIAGYRSKESGEEFVAIFKGEIEREKPTLARIHSQCLTGDVFGSLKCDCGAQLHRAMEMIETEGRGAIVYQLQEGRGIGIINKIRAYALQDEGADTVEANEQLGLAVDLREYRQCAEILFDLGLCRVRLISNNPLKLRAVEEAGLQVVERVAIEVEHGEAAAHYMRTKKEKLGHLLETIK
jgi:3,4-dihydroxy 2-butanone 4-phosphate synthase/GTP cyclohydrolase II